MTETIAEMLREHRTRMQRIQEEDVNDTRDLGQINTLLIARNSIAMNPNMASELRTLVLKHLTRLEENGEKTEPVPSATP